jgi:ATP-independent RNA helicase DbpA
MSQASFSTLNIQPDLLSNLTSMGYEFMTPIQEQSLPHILAGKDVIAQGKTGSGKTAAFGLGLLESLDPQRFKIQSLVLCPTRELADQVAKEIRKLARTIGNIKVLTLCGGVPLKPQIHSLEYGAHIIVGTPGRIEDHLTRGTLKLEHVKTLVLDEADRMLEMGFQSALDAIFAKIPTERQTLLLSATFPDKIKKIANRTMNKPVMVQVESKHESDSISQHFFEVSSDEDRMKALRLLLLEHSPESTVVFCNTKREAQDVTDTLINEGFSALDLTGDLEQRDRDQTLVQFANKSISVLIATDVAARGLDIENLDAVINFELAQDPESHVHRIGRTGRAGSKGIACTLFSARDGYKMTMLEDFLEQPLKAEPLPDKSVLDRPPLKSTMATLQIGGGKKQKVRAGDILGALTGDNGIDGKQVGKIQIFDNWAYVAVNRDVTKVAIKKIESDKIKGRSFRVRVIGK